MAPVTPVSDLVDTVVSHLLPRSLIPTRTNPDIPDVVRRQATVTVTVIAQGGGSGSGSSNLSTGSIVGIVIGSVVGILLIAWLIRSCTAMNHPEQYGEPYGQARHRGSSPQTRHRRRHSHHSAYEYSPPRSRQRSRSTRSSRPIVIEKTSVSPRPPPVAVYETHRSRSRY